MSQTVPDRPTDTSLIAQLNTDFTAECLRLHCLATLDVFFLVYLRRHARFGYFILGPVTIDVRLMETLVERTAVVGEQRGVTDDYVRYTQLLMEEVRQSGAPRIDELHLLLAFMRCHEGLPGRVFGELGVTPEQVVQYLHDHAQRAGQQLHDPTLLPGERLLTPEQVAAYLQVHVDTVRGWIRSGTLPARRVAGLRALRVRFADVQALLQPVEEAEPRQPHQTGGDAAASP
jgi:excisionase family DNA binding protein